MFDWLLGMFDARGFPARWHCGEWLSLLGWVHIASDVAIWLAYMGIPAVLMYFVRRRRDVPFLPVFVLFTLFIASAGRCPPTDDPPPARACFAQAPGRTRRTLDSVSRRRWQSAMSASIKNAW